MGKGDPNSELAELFQVWIGKLVADGSWHPYRYRACGCSDPYESDRKQYEADLAWQADNPDQHANVIPITRAREGQIHATAISQRSIVRAGIGKASGNP